MAGSKTDFIRHYHDNTAKYEQAKKFWDALDENGSLLFVSILFLVGILGAVLYYISFNNTSGRHYTPKYWAYFLLGVFVVTLMVTLGSEWLIAEPKLNGASLLEWQIAICNAIYATGVYFVFSFIWCNIDLLPTNAYRWLKIKRK